MPIAFQELCPIHSDLQSPDADEFFNDVQRGLTSEPKSLDSKYFYDQRGSQLFDKICDLPEYYVTRAELEIMSGYVAEMAKYVGEKAALIEYGSGSGLKTDLLLDALPEDAVYVPLDISHDHLWEASRRLAEKHPNIHIYPVTADFTQRVVLPRLNQEVERNVVYFPGSTIGNFEPTAGQEVLDHIAELIGNDGGLLIGIDLRKDPEVLHAAYDDAQGVTAEFNLNLLTRINAELDANFNLEQFSHLAIWNSEQSRIEMHLQSEQAQIVKIGDEEIEFAAGETIRTEYSHKYSIESFSKLAASSGLTLQESWQDSGKRFAILYFEPSKR